MDLVDKELLTKFLAVSSKGAIPSGRAVGLDLGVVSVPLPELPGGERDSQQLYYHDL